MKTVRVQNPGPAALWVINGRKKNMRKAKRKGVRRRAASATVRRKSARRHRSHNPNPTRRVARGHHRRVRVIARRPRRHVSRRLNPGRGTGLLAKGLVLAIGAAGVQFLVSFVPPIGGVSAPADAIRTIAVGWLASIGMKRTGFLARYGDDVFLASATLAGGKIVSAILVPFALRLFPQRAPAPAPMEAGNAAAMAGLATLYPGQQLFNRYQRAGMGGLATWYPGMQPFQHHYTVPGVPMA